MDKSSENIDSSYISYIDGLRAIAVLAVVIYHLNSTWLPGGFTGVDIFFTISGFVVAFSVAKKRGLSPVNFVASFYARRILRIVPALLVCLIVVSIAEVLFIPKSWVSDNIDIIANFAFFGLSNLSLLIVSNSYFDARSELNPFTHTWSLGIEEQFYLIFPLLFYGWTITDKNSRLKNVSITLFTVFFAFSIVCAYWLSSRNAPLAFYSIFSRFWELAVGVILYQITANRYDNSETSLKSKWSLGIYISVALVILGFVFARPDNFPYPWALFPVLGTIGLLFFLHGNKNNLFRAGLSNKFVVFIGKISYSLYLWHWPVFILFRWTVGLDSIPYYISAIFIAFLLTLVSYYLVELPIRYSHKIRSFPKARIVFVGLGIVALVCYTTNTQIFSHRPQLSLSVILKDEALWYPEKVYTSSFNPYNSSCPTKVSVNSIKGGEVFSYSSANCQEQMTSSRLFVAGDSHAVTYGPMLQRLSMETNTNVFLYWKPACSYISLSAPIDQLSADCRLFYKWSTTDILDRAQPGDVIFLPSLRVKLFVNQSTSFREEEVREAMFGKAAVINRAKATEEAIALLKVFTQRGIKVVFEPPKPIFRAPNFRCSDWFNRMNPICKPGLEMPKDVLINYRLPVMESIETLSKEVYGVTVWDSFPLLCPGNLCQANVNHKPLFFDGDHISPYGNMVVYPSFKTFIGRLIQYASKEEGGV